MKRLFAILIACASYFGIFAQSESGDAPFKDLGVGLRVSTLGVGVEATTTLSNYFKLRGGFDLATYSRNFTIGITDDNLSTLLGYEPDYKMKAKLNFFSGHVLVDIHPLRSGIFHFTTGFYIGNNKLKANGRLVDPSTGEDSQLPPGHSWDEIELELDKHGISIDEGHINGSIELGNVIKPYFGIGLGRSVPKSRLGFMFELGVLYQGDWKIKQNGKKVESLEVGDNSFGDGVEDARKWLRWWPMVGFQLTYRIF